MAGGAQPIANEAGTVHAAMNGEIFNHRALRRELEAAGHVFATRCDTEVVVHGYEEWGEGLPARLEGEFALAVLDRRTPAARLLLARDRPGVKPLFLARVGRGLAFASEPKALVPLLPAPPRVDPSALPFYLQLGYRPGPATAWHGIEKLPPAHLLVLEEGRSRLARYWRRPDPDPARASRPFPELVEEAAALVRAGVQARLESEVPLGGFLSGGIDSSAVVAAMVDAGRGPVETFSAGYAEPAWDERGPAAEVARILGTRHTAFALGPEAVETALDRLVEVYDEPFGDSSALPSMALARHARERVTVALSGDGGDEVFGGYVHLRWHLEAEALRVLPAPVLALGARVLRRLAPAGSRPARLATRLSRAAADPVARHLAFTRLVPEPELAGYLPEARPGALEAELRPRFPRGQAPLDRILAFDFDVPMVEDFLTKVDRASASRGLEVRVPLLSTPLIEWAFRLPAATKLRGRVLKGLLRETLRGRLPPGLLDRPKHGFTAPVGPWLGGALQDLARDRLLGPGSALAPRLSRLAVEGLLEAQTEGRLDRGELIWRLLVLERWLRTPLGSGS